MAQVDFIYPAADEAGLGALVSLSVFADSDLSRARMAEDARAAGVDVRQTAAFEQLLTGDVRPLGDIALVDCPEVTGHTLGSLLRLDQRAAQAACQVVVLTRLDALEDVYACVSESDAQILVDPTKGECVLALGRALARIRGMRVREFSDDERITLLRLTEQVEDIAKRLDNFPQRGPDGVFRFEAPGRDYRGSEGMQDGRLRASKPPLPDARLVRELIARRQRRANFFGKGLFADPAWDMLLDLTAARVERRRVSVTSLCIASGVPATTALRWINQMIEIGLFERVEDESDKRRAFIGLTDKAADAMARFFAHSGWQIG